MQAGGFFLQQVAGLLVDPALQQRVVFRISHPPLEDGGIILTGQSLQNFRLSAAPLGQPKRVGQNACGLAVVLIALQPERMGGAPESIQILRTQQIQDLLAGVLACDLSQHGQSHGDIQRRGHPVFVSGAGQSLTDEAAEPGVQRRVIAESLGPEALQVLSPGTKCIEIAVFQLPAIGFDVVFLPRTGSHGGIDRFRQSRTGGSDTAGTQRQEDDQRQ